MENAKSLYKQNEDNRKEINNNKKELAAAREENSHLKKTSLTTSSKRVHDWMGKAEDNSETSFSYDAEFSAMMKSPSKRSVKNDDEYERLAIRMIQEEKEDHHSRIHPVKRRAPTNRLPSAPEARDQQVCSRPRLQRHRRHSAAIQRGPPNARRTPPPSPSRLAAAAKENAMADDRSQTDAVSANWTGSTTTTSPLTSAVNIRPN